MDETEAGPSHSKPASPDQSLSKMSSADAQLLHDMSMVNRAGQPDLSELTGNDTSGHLATAKENPKIASNPDHKQEQPRQLKKIAIPGSFEQAEEGDKWILFMHQDGASMSDMCKVWEIKMESSITPNNLSVRLHRMEASFMEVRAHHVTELVKIVDEVDRKHEDDKWINIASILNQRTGYSYRNKTVKDKYLDVRRKGFAHVAENPYSSLKLPKPSPHSYPKVNWRKLIPLKEETEEEEDDTGVTVGQSAAVAGKTVGTKGRGTQPTAGKHTAAPPKRKTLDELLMDDKDDGEGGEAHRKKIAGKRLLGTITSKDKENEE